MNTVREWMYRRYRAGSLTVEFLNGLKEFMQFACTQHEYMNGSDIKCPCCKCKNKPFQPPHVVRAHILKNSFLSKYYLWWVHGEQGSSRTEETSLRAEIGPNPFETMVLDAAGPNLNLEEQAEESPNPQAQQLYNMLSAANKELYPGCVKFSQLSLVARLMSMKSNHKMSEMFFDELSELINDLLPENHSAPKDFYSTKKLMKGLGLPFEVIHCCRNHCMIFWEGDKHLTRCKFCGTNHYKDHSGNESNSKRKDVPHSKMYYFPLTPRLQRLYASRATAAEMRWHTTSWSDGSMPTHRRGNILTNNIRNLLLKFEMSD